MPAYWLTPVRATSAGVLFGKERTVLEPSREAELFRQKLHEVHPRLLPMFKANLLLSDEAILQCGVDELPFELGNGEDICFAEVEAALKLSHCAEAFMDRLLAASEGEMLCRRALEPDTWVNPLGEWLGLMLGWFEAGFQVILLREDGG
ncbi:hypothetical protein [Paenibacillus hamazuiensis]|uniref:hypothetical protein n=1 Tax=Paenibacillus hamazuiensis TaxID=2936508 RepID=UPI00200DF462|nr:hypothetical protein [Paenibacillus hamazuiensis]